MHCNIIHMQNSSSLCIRPHTTSVSAATVHCCHCLSGFQDDHSKNRQDFDSIESWQLLSNIGKNTFTDLPTIFFSRGTAVCAMHQLVKELRQGKKQGKQETPNNRKQVKREGLCSLTHQIEMSGAADSKTTSTDGQNPVSDDLPTTIVIACNYGSICILPATVVK